MTSPAAAPADRPLTAILTVFSKCSPAMEDGRRYENMAWRLWARETFCCQPDHVVQPQWSFDPEVAAGATAESIEKCSERQCREYTFDKEGWNSST